MGRISIITLLVLATARVAAARSDTQLAIDEILTTQQATFRTNLDELNDDKKTRCGPWGSVDADAFATIARRYKTDLSKAFDRTGLEDISQHVKVTFPDPPPGKKYPCGNRLSMAKRAWFETAADHVITDIKSNGARIHQVRVKSSPVAEAMFTVWSVVQPGKESTGVSNDGVIPLPSGRYKFEASLEGYATCAATDLRVWDEHGPNTLRVTLRKKPAKSDCVAVRER